MTVGVVLETAAGVGAERGGAGVGPDIRPPAAALTEPDVIDMRRVALFEQRQKLVLGAIEAAHASVRFRPDDQIDGSEAEIDGRGVDNRIAAPVDEGREQAAVGEVGQSSAHPGFVEGEIFRRAHFSRGHRELTMAPAGHIARDGDVVGLVGVGAQPEIGGSGGPPGGFRRAFERRACRERSCG